MSARTLAHKMTVLQRNILVGHVCGPRRIVRAGSMRSFNTLMYAGLIRATNENASSLSRHTHSALTELGREVVAYVLAEAAEALIAAGFAEGPPPTEAQITDRLKRRKSAPVAQQVP